ncbi:MAG: HEAT repeat domain-containing protein [Polyangia bacterium]
MAAADALIGTTVGDYKLTGILGEGGMGIVYAAEHLTLGSRTACKVLRREVMDNPDAVARFLQEARLISRVRHRNLIDIFDAGELPDGRLYYIMEYLKGQPLQDRIAAGPRLTFAEIVHLLRQIGAGLQAAHGAGIVHRDLKPANIFLVAQPGAPPLVKVVDFGVAKVLNMSGPQAKLTRTGTLVGTPHYMAPEQINGRSVDARADVYALGVILYELCTGQVPFPGDMLGDVVIGHIQKPVPLPAPAQLPSGAPSGLVDVLLKALAKSPDDRYPGVHALIEDLERLARGEQTTARGRRASQILQLRQQPGAPGTTGTRPRILLLGAAALAAVLALVAGGALWWRLRGGGPKDGPDMLALRSFALQELQRGLADGDPEVRGLAVEGLRQGGDVRQRGLLEARLHDPDPAIQALAARALAALGSRAAVPALLARLDEGGEPAVRGACGEALVQLGEPAGQKALTEALGASRYPQVQLQAALALQDAGAAGPDTAAAKLLGERLARARPGDDDAVQILSRRARRGDAEALAQLRQLLPGGDVQHPRQLRVAAALAGLGEDTARSLLAEAASRPGPLQLGAAQLLCTQDDATGLLTLRQAISAPGTSPAERLLSARALGGCGERADAKLLYGRLRDGEKGMPLRQTEAGSLLRLASGDPAVLAELSAGWAALALGDEDWNVRAAAATALGELDPAQAVPLLQKALRDGRAEVRRSAALALGRSGGAAALKALVGTLSDESVVVRLAALQAIAAAGQAARARGQAPEPGLLAALTSGAPADASERAARAGALAALGQDSGRAGLEEALRSGDGRAQRIAVEAAATDPQLRQALLPKVLDDKAVPLAARARAAEALAEQGDGRGAATLREAASAGGADGVRARAALRRIGESGESDGDAGDDGAAALLQSEDVETRRTAVAAFGQLPSAQAVPLLMKATRDPAGAVRGQAGETAAELRGESAALPGLPVLRALLRDADAGVRARAASLLARLLRAAEAAQATARPTAEKPQPRDASRGTEPRSSTGSNPGPAAGGDPATGAGKPSGGDSGATEAGDGRSRRGLLLVEAPSGSEFQIDRQPAQRATGKPIAVSAGPHRISHAGGVTEVTVTEGATATVKLTASQVAQLVQSGVEALGRKDYRRARKALERASTLCSRRSDEKATCTSLAFELSFSLGRVYEGQEAWAEAMTEYDKILFPGFPGKVKPEGKAQVAAAQQRLASRLGKLRVSKPVKGRCQTVELWMPPGRHRVNVAGGQFVQVRARETVEVSGCP